MGADTRIQANAVDDLLGVQSLHLRIRIQLVEVGYAQSKISIGKKFDSLRLGEAHEKGVYIFFNGALLQESRKRMRGSQKTCIVYVRADNDAARIQVIVQRLAFA